MFDVVVNFLHLLATAVWLGGALFIHFILQPSLAVLEAPQAGRVLRTVAMRFSIAAWASIIVLLVTGILKTPDGMLFDTSDEMGFTLTVKHVFVLAVVVIGLVIGLVIVPRLRRAAPADGQRPLDEFIRCQKRLKLLSTTNTVFGVVILVCASMLW